VKSRQLIARTITFTIVVITAVSPMASALTSISDDRTDKVPSPDMISTGRIYIHIRDIFCLKSSMVIYVIF